MNKESLKYAWKTHRQELGLWVVVVFFTFYKFMELHHIDMTRYSMP